MTSSPTARRVILGIDAAALALIVGDQGFRADANGVQAVAPQWLERTIDGIDAVTLRNVGRGHPLFGPASTLIRSEALIRLDSEAPEARQEPPHSLDALIGPVGVLVRRADEEHV